MVLFMDMSSDGPYKFEFEGVFRFIQYPFNVRIELRKVKGKVPESNPK
jgi:hypothetical protein